MAEDVKIYVRGVYWKSIHLNVSTGYFDIALYSHQDCSQHDLEPETTIEYDIVRTYIQQESVIVAGTWKRDPYVKTTYVIKIDDPDIYIWDTNSLTRISFLEKEYQRPRNDVGEIKNRFEILDL